MKLTIRIVQDEKGEFVAICSSLPGCMSKGCTRDEAQQNLAEAILGYLAAVGDAPELVNELIEV